MTKTDPLKILEDSIESVRTPDDVPSHEILNMHRVFAVIDECHRLRKRLNRVTQLLEDKNA